MSRLSRCVTVSGTGAAATGALHRRHQSPEPSLLATKDLLPQVGHTARFSPYDTAGILRISSTGMSRGDTGQWKFVEAGEQDVSIATIWHSPVTRDETAYETGIIEGRARERRELTVEHTPLVIAAKRLIRHIRDEDDHASCFALVQMAIALHRELAKLA